IRLASDGAVKIMDFGIARLQSADVTGSGAIVGTPTYMAPEQITNGAITPATDLFAVGCLLYELLTYHKPFQAETVHGVLYQVLTTDPKPVRASGSSLPAALERVVGKALNKVPEDRYETAREMQSALFSIRVGLSGATDVTARLSLRWTPLPSAVLRLVTHAPIRWRAAALTALMVTALVLLYVSRSPSPVAAPFPSTRRRRAKPRDCSGMPNRPSTGPRPWCTPWPRGPRRRAPRPRWPVRSRSTSRWITSWPGWRRSPPSKSASPRAWRPRRCSRPTPGQRSASCCRTWSARSQVSESETCRC